MVGDQLTSGSSPAADRDQQVALGDDARRRRLRIADRGRPGPFSTIFAGGLAQRVRTADGQLDLEDPLLHPHTRLLLSASVPEQSAIEARRTESTRLSTPFRRGLATADSGPAPPAEMQQPTAPSAAARSRRPGGLVVAASGRGTTERRHDPGRVLRAEMRVCHTLSQAGRRPRSARPRRCVRLGALGGRGRPDDRGDRQAQVEYPRPDNGNAAVSMPATWSPARTSTTSPPTSGCTPACPARRRRKVPGGPGAQVFANNGCGGCHTLAAAELGRRHRPEPRRSPAAARRAAMIDRIDRRPERGDRQGLPGERDAAELRADDLSPKEIEQLVEYLIENTAGGEGRRRRPAARSRGGRRPRGRCDHLPAMRARLRDRFEISPRRYAQVTARRARLSLATIVLTGAAVRLTASGLGCPDWPKCYGGTVPAPPTPRRDRVRQLDLHRTSSGSYGGYFLPRCGLRLAPGPVRGPAAARLLSRRPPSVRSSSSHLAPGAGAYTGSFIQTVTHHQPGGDT